MKTLLISPYQYLDSEQDFIRLKQPLGIALLKQNTCSKISILDALAEGYNNRKSFEGVLRVGLELNDIKNRINREKPEIVGVSNLWSANYPAVLEIIKYVKRDFPKIITILGGVHPSFEYPEIIKEPSIDYIAIREATKSFPKLIEFLEGKRLWKDVTGFVRFNGRHPELSGPTENANLKELKPIDYRIFPVEIYSQQKKFGEQFKNFKNADLVSSVGCPHNCDYCSTKKMWPGKLRTYSSEQLNFMLDTILKAGYNFVSVQDDNLAANPNHAKNLIKKLNERNLPWHWEGGVEIKLLPYILEDICNSTCKIVDMAIETKNKNNSGIYNKFSNKTNLEEVLHKELESLQKADIFVNSNFMLGVPRESKKEMMETILYAKELKDKGLINHANFHLTMAFPGTELAKLNYEKPKGRNPKDYFGYAAGIGNIPYPEMNRKKLIQLRNEADIFVNNEKTYKLKRAQMNRY